MNNPFSIYLVFLRFWIFGAYRYQKEITAAKLKIYELTKSRDIWRTRYELLEIQFKELCLKNKP